MSFKKVDPNPDFTKLEKNILDFWEKDKTFEKSLEQTKDGNPFTFYDGPPFATGLPHHGHILSSTIKDVIPRYQTMKGRFVRRRWGWDCHGLPIEEIVERELGISGKKDIEEKIGIKKFNETCRSTVLKYATEWGRMVKRIARWIEFDNSYKTMDADYMESTWYAFETFYDKGLVYEGRKVLLYCPRCETPISNFEVAMDNSYQDVTDESVIVKFQISNSKSQINSKLQIPNDNPTYFLAWTTTPWTLPGNLALAVGEDIEYVVVEAGNQNFILAKELLKKAFSTDYTLLTTVSGKDLVGIEYTPLFDIPEMQDEKAYKIYPADFVTTEDGTGIVHTAVVYGEDDYKLGQEVGLPVVPLLDEKGKFNDLSPEFIRGDEFKKSEEKIIADLSERSLLFSKEKYRHSYPHCWRCGHALFYNAIPSWFIDIQKIKSDLLETNEKQINWYPEHLKTGRYQKSVEQAPDWNISRNRYWGNPIPIWKCEDNHNTVVGSIQELKEKAEMGYEDGMDLHRPYIDDVVLKCDECGKEAKRITEIFDSWFEAGSMPFAEYHYPFENKEVFESRYPAQFVAEYIAQTRAWFYVMHVIGLTMQGRAPFENVVTTGTILAEDGSKMSKSKNNFPDPWEVIENYGVDSLRFYLMNSTVMQAENLNFSERDLQIVNRKVFRILWNVFNYFVTYANNSGWQPETSDKQPAINNILDKWQIAKNKELVNQVTEHMDNYDTVRATRVIEDYINNLSTWYIRRSRGRVDKEFFQTLYDSLLTVSRVVAPVMPYISEEIYQTLIGDESVHLSDWPENQQLEESEKELLSQMEQVRSLVEKVHAIRAQEGVKLRQPLGVLEIPDLENMMTSPELVEILKEETNVKTVKVGKEVKLDLTITPELKIEGLAADLQRQINSLRKEQGMQIGEMKDLCYMTDSDELKKAISLVDLEKVYASQVIEGEVDDATCKDIEINGERIKIGLR